MNYIGFNQDGGFRLSTNILNAVQAAYSLFNALGYIAGDKTIITGCIVTGTNVSDGIVFLNGQVYNFKGGSLGTNVIVKQIITNYPFQNGMVKPVLFERFIGFGTSLPEETYLWSDFKRPFQTKDIQAFKDDHETRITALEQKQAFYVGMVLRYDEPLIVLPPPGFIDHIPNEEQGRVWVGRSLTDDDFGLGSIGGEKKHKLEIAEMPIHRVKVRAYLGTENRVPNGGSGENGNNRDIMSDPIGGDIPHNNLQPYVAVRFIKYVGI